MHFHLRPSVSLLSVQVVLNVASTPFKTIESLGYRLQGNVEHYTTKVGWGCQHTRASSSSFTSIGAAPAQDVKSRTRTESECVARMRHEI